MNYGRETLQVFEHCLWQMPKIKHHFNIKIQSSTYMYVQILAKTNDQVCERYYTDFAKPSKFPYRSNTGTLFHEKGKTVNTVESLNKGHFRTVFLSFVRSLYSLGGPKCIGTIGRKSLGPQAVSFVERLSLFQSVHYERFHCTYSTYVTEHP